MNELGDLLRIGSLQGFERRDLAAELLHQTVDDGTRPFRAESRVENALGISDAARHDIAPRDGKLVKLLQNLFRLLRGHRVQLRNFLSQQLNLIFIEKTK